MAGKEDEKQERDELADSLNDLFTNLSTMIKGDLQVLSLSLLPLSRSICIYTEYLWMYKYTYTFSL